MVVQLIDLTWHAVHTEAGKERVAHDALEAAGYAVFFPWYFNRVRHARAVQEVRRALMPRYLFIGIDDGQGLHKANSAMGVSAVVHLGDVPGVVPAEWIERMRARCDEAGQYLDLKAAIAPGRSEPRMERGTPVVIVDGPAMTTEGWIERDDGESPIVTIGFQMFNGHVMTSDILVSCLRRRKAG